jgi:hypothetical protein
MKHLGWIALALLVTACNVSSSNFTIVNATTGSPFPQVTGNNTMAISVSNVYLCNGVANMPCVTVKICNPGDASTCVTVGSILLDTGSFGLRVFSSAMAGPPSLTLTPVVDASAHPVAECAQFAGGNDWGPVKLASVIIGNEPAVQIPIQVIDMDYPTAGGAAIPQACTPYDTDPVSANFNGILGVGLQDFDCGSACSISSGNPGIYYGCNGGTCTVTEVPADITHQVINPVAALPVDNNGVIVTFGAVTPTTGVGSDSGQMIFGIDTSTNNTPTAGTTAYTAETTGAFANFNGTLNSHSFAHSTFLDSGSNGLFFPASVASVPLCSDGSFFCPSAILSLNGTLSGIGGGALANFSIKVNNADTLFGSGNRVFSNLGGSMTFGYMDLGMAFFLGKTVYVGIQNKTSTTLGTGPYWAF